jgi:hypothetical protein
MPAEQHGCAPGTGKCLTRYDLGTAVGGGDIDGYANADY